MTALDLLSKLSAMGVDIQSDGDKLRLRAPSGTLDDELRAELGAHKGEILTLLQARQSASLPRLQPSQTRQYSVPLPLSSAQQRLWFLDRMEPGNPAFNMSYAVRLTGELDALALERSLDAIIRRHDILRTNFMLRDGEPVQIVVPARDDYVLSTTDLSRLAPVEKEAEVTRIAQAEAHHAFDLSQEPLIRAELLRLGQLEHVFVLTVHHIIADAWSIGVLANEMASIYASYADGKPVSLPELPIQYSDYASWQQGCLANGVFDYQLAYWREQLGGELTYLEFPLDFSRPSQQTFRGANQSLRLSQDLILALNRLAQREKVTLFMVLLAAFKVLLYRYTGQDDIIVGSPIAGRTQEEMEPLIGVFLNTLALRTDLSGNPTFEELLQREFRVTADAYAHQDVPFESLLDELQPERTLSHTPFFQIFFNMVNRADSAFALPGLTVQQMSNPERESKFDLTLYVQETADLLSLLVVYNADLFQDDRMAEMLAQYQLLLEQIVAAPSQSIDSYSLLTVRSQQLLPDPSQPLSDEWHGAIHDQLAAVAHTFPDQIAASDKHGVWTYGELNARSNQLAHFLQAGSVKPQDVVAIYGHRSASLVWAVMGILKAGAGFLILNPDYPTSRLVDYLQLARPRGWLQLQEAGEPSPDIAAALDAVGCDCRLTLPSSGDVETWEGLATYHVSDPQVKVGPNDLACLSFTSGSTGTPKGVMGRHGSLTHFLPWQTQRFDFTSQDRFSMLSGLAHDPLQRDIFTALWVGARLCIPDPSRIGMPGWLASWLVEEGVTIANLTPAMGQMIADTAMGQADQYAIPSLRYAFYVGDTLTRRDSDRIYRMAPNVTIVNYYGSTETQRALGYYVVERPDERSTRQTLETGCNGHQHNLKEVVPLGIGLPGAQILVLTSDGRQAGIGELGEIYIRSHHLAAGYAGDMEATRQRFLSNPFSDRPGDRLYRSGDLGRYRPDGNVEFLGRTDHQVKIRGFRVELGEIEAQIGKHPAVKEAIVMSRTDAPGQPPYLVAYVVPSSSTASFSQADLHEFLKTHLPDYMVPTAYVVLEQMPVTPNGKINRQALPTPDRLRSDLSAEYVAPRTPVEQALVRIWSDLLGVENVGIHDNFFDLGGHSLLGVRMFVHIEEDLGIRLPLATLFRAPTIAQLAEAISTQDVSSDWQTIVPITVGGTGQPFFCVHGFGGSVLGYADLARQLGPDQTFYGLQAVGLNGEEEPDATVEAMATRYIDAMHSVQPSGPYLIGGYCFGGVIAYEMARQLSEKGEETALVAIMEGYAPYIYRKQQASAMLRERTLTIWRSIPYWLEEYVDLGVTGIRRRIVRKLRRLWHALFGSKNNEATYRPEDIVDDDLSEISEHHMRMMRTHLQASRTYASGPYSGRVTLYTGRTMTVSRVLLGSLDPENGWGKLALGGVDVCQLDGAHRNIHLPPFVDSLAKELQADIAVAQAALPSAGRKESGVVR